MVLSMTMRDRAMFVYLWSLLKGPERIRMVSSMWSATAWNEIESK